MNCDTCINRLPETSRRLWWCGWLPEESWCGPGMRVTSAGMVETTVCPGYSIRDPRVHQAAIAWQWREKGQLQIRFKKPWPVLLDLIDVFNGGVNEANEWLMKKAREGK